MCDDTKENKQTYESTDDQRLNKWFNSICACLEICVAGAGGPIANKSKDPPEDTKSQETAGDSMEGSKESQEKGPAETSLTAASERVFDVKLGCWKEKPANCLAASLVHHGHMLPPDMGGDGNQSRDIDIARAKTAIGDMEIMSIFDSASSNTYADDDFVEHLKARGYRSLRRKEAEQPITVRMANGHLHLVTEQVRLSYTMGGKKGKFTFYVMKNLPGPLLFGMDWLYKVSGSIDVGMQMINVRSMGVKLPLKMFKVCPERVTKRLLVTETYIVAPFTSQYVELHAWSAVGHSPTEGIATIFVENEDTDLVDKGLMVAAGVKEFNKGTAMVAVTNWSNECVKIPAYSNVASAFFYNKQTQSDMKRAPCFMIDDWDISPSSSATEATGSTPILQSEYFMRVYDAGCNDKQAVHCCIPSTKLRTHHAKESKKSSDARRNTLSITSTNRSTNHPPTKRVRIDRSGLRLGGDRAQTSEIDTSELTGITLSITNTTQPSSSSMTTDTTSTTNTTPPPMLNLPEGVTELGEDLTPDQQEQLRSLIMEYHPWFYKDGEEMKTTSLTQHSIDTGDSKPINAALYRIPAKHREEIRNQTQKMLKLKVIEPSSSPWAAPVVLAPKPDGSWRFCVDYRKLNAATKRDVYPLPRIDAALAALGGSQYFTTIDLASGYWQVPLRSEDKEKTAFITPEGLYQYLYMPFGLTNAPATFQRLMDAVLAGVKWQCCLVYLDDIIIFSQSFDKHLRDIRKVFDRIKGANLTVKGSKCKFAMRKCNFLGRVVDINGTHPNPKKIEAVKNFPEPKKARNIQEFLGLVGFYRSFIPNMAKIAYPMLQCLTTFTNEKKWNWTDECREAFDTLKKKLINYPILRHPDNDKPFVVETDASKKGLGAILSQEHDDGSHPVEFISRTLSRDEKKWSTTEQEALGVVWACEQFRHYLIGTPFKVITDHNALRWVLHSTKSGRLQRWSLRLQEFEFEVYYRKGSLTAGPDALSRNPIPSNPAELSDRHEENSDPPGTTTTSRDNIEPSSSSSSSADATMIDEQEEEAEVDPVKNVMFTGVEKQGITMVAQAEGQVKIPQSSDRKGSQDGRDNLAAKLADVTGHACKSGAGIPSNTQQRKALHGLAVPSHNAVSWDAGSLPEKGPPGYTKGSSKQKRGGSDQPASDLCSRTHQTRPPAPKPRHCCKDTTQPSSVNTRLSLANAIVEVEEDIIHDFRDYDRVFRDKMTDQQCYALESVLGIRNENEQVAMEDDDDEEDEKEDEIRRKIPTNAITSRKHLRAWKLAQLQDPEFESVVRKLRGLEPSAETKKGWLPKIANFYLDSNDILHYNDDSSIDATNEQTGRVVVPESKRLDIMVSYHDAKSRGHQGVNQTRRTIREKFWWPGLTRDVKEYVLSCVSCRKTKLTRQKLGELVPIIIAEPFHTWSMDFIGPFPKSDEGNTHVLVMIDQFTRIPIFEPVKEQTADAAAKAMYKRLLSRFGVPVRVITDKGAQFTSELFRKVSRLFGVKNIYTTAYHPQSNGKTERLNRVLKSALKTQMAKNRDWCDLLPAIEFAVATAFHSALNTTPFEMLYGRMAMQPLDVLFGSRADRRKHQEQLNNGDYVAQLADRVRRAHEAANEHQLREAKKMQEHYNQKAKPVQPYAVGKSVYLYKPNLGKGLGPKKLMHNWIGPYTVVEFLPPNNVVIENDANKERSTVHVLRVREVPIRPAKWIKQDEQPQQAQIGPQLSYGPQPLEKLSTLIAWQDKEEAVTNPNHFHLGIPEVDQSGEENDFLRVHQWDAPKNQTRLAMKKYGPLMYKMSANGTTWEERITHRQLKGHLPWLTSVPKANIFETSVILGSDGSLPQSFLTSYTAALKPASALAPGKQYEN